MRLGSEEAGRLGSNARQCVRPKSPSEIVLTQFHGASKGQMSNQCQMRTEWSGGVLE
jgi:hypothetical protein